MSLQLKDAGVCVASNKQTLQPEIMFALGVAEEIFAAIHCDCVVTSALDGTHNPGSLHSQGLAVDLRTVHLPETQRKEVFDRLSNRLRQMGFDVLLEGSHATEATTAPHIHIEYDPKGRRFWSVMP